MNVTTDKCSKTVQNVTSSKLHVWPKEHYITGLINLKMKISDQKLQEEHKYH